MIKRFFYFLLYLMEYFGYNYFDRRSNYLERGITMISSDSIRGYNDTIILSLLMEGDSYGYEISKRIREGTKENYIIKETTLYSTFTRLEKQGYLTSYPGTQTHGKKRTYYSISSLGKTYLESKKEEWQQTKKVVDYFLKESQNNEDY